MKRIVYLIGILSAVQSLGAITAKEYESWIKKNKETFSVSFTKDTDLINVYLSLRGGLLQTRRLNGAGWFDKDLFDGCSYNDRSDDPMTQSLIFFSPSS